MKRLPEHCYTVRILLFSVLVLLTFAAAGADTVVLVIPLEGVTVISIGQGEVVYLYNGSKRREPLREVTAIYFTGAPLLTEGEKLLAAGKSREAASVLEKALTQTEDINIRVWLLGRLALAQGKAGNPALALATLARIAPVDDDLYWLDMLPSLDNATDSPGHLTQAEEALRNIKNSSKEEYDLVRALEAALVKIKPREPGKQGENSISAEKDAAAKVENGNNGLKPPDNTSAEDISAALKSAAETELPGLYYRAGERELESGRPAAAGLYFMRCVAVAGDAAPAVSGYLATAEIYDAVYDKPRVSLTLAEKALSLARVLDDEMLIQKAETAVNKYRKRTDGVQP